MGEEWTEAEAAYLRVIGALTMHLLRFHEIDAFRMAEDLHEAGLLIEQDVRFIRHHLNRLIRRPAP